MKKMSVPNVALLLLSSIGVMTESAVAAPPAAINIHGQLLSSSGDPVTGTRTYSVQFHDASTAGNLLGGALTGSVDVSDEGLFNVSIEPPASILTAAEVWYSLGVDTDVPADNSPADDVFPSRIRVYSVPFALQAGEVDASGVGSGSVDNTEFDALDGVTGDLQAQIDAIDASGIAADISQLETDVAAKANSTDVYTTTEADTNFVDATGDTMSGVLGVDTISEATTNAGVTADGVTLKDSFVLLAPIAAPGDTTGKLYNVGGSLFFNGAAVGGTTVNKDAINNSGALGFDWLDAELDNALTIAGGTVNNDSFSALSDLTAESAIGTGAGQVAAGNHGHTLSALSGSVTDAQVPDALTISSGTVNNNSFSALSDLTAESAIGASAGQVAAGDHGHTLSALSGSVTDAQVPDTITISSVDAADDAVGTPAFSYASDPNTGIHRPGADVLGLVTNGALRLSVDDTEVNLLGNILEIASGSAPGVTANKLYNNSGNLFWNGTQLDAGGGGGADRETLIWTSNYIGTGYNNLTMFGQKMIAAGSVVGFQAWCTTSTGTFAVDLKKNGVTMLTSPLSFVADSVAEGSLSATAFDAGDVLTLDFTNGTGDLFGGSVSIIVEY